MSITVTTSPITINTIETTQINVTVSETMAAINGLPRGGNTNYLVAKNSTTDFDMKYVPAGSGSGVVIEIQAGTNVTVDNTDPAYPIVSSVGGGGGGDMYKSVYDPTNINGSAFNTDNHISGTTNKVYTATEQTKLSGIAAGAEVNVNADWNSSSGDSQILNKPTISGSNTGDQDLSSYETKAVVSGKQMFHGMFLKPIAALPTNLTTTTFTLGATANPCSYYYQGTLVSVSSDKTTTIGATLGKYYIYFNAATGNLLNSVDFPGVLTSSNVLVATVVWNGTDYGIVNVETHGHDRNHQWHYWAHENIGTLYTSGITLTHNGGTGAAATFATTAGEIDDEDIHFTVKASSAFPTANTCRLWYQTASGVYAFDKTPSAVPFQRGTGDRPVYIDASSYAITTLPSATNRYVNYFVYASLDRHTPIYVITETAVAATIANGYTTTALARAVPFPNLAGSNVSAELRPIYRLVVRADGRVEALITADDYRKVSSIPQGGGTTATTASAVTFNPSGGIESATVQTALEELDTEKQATLVSGTSIKTVNSNSLLGSGDVTVQATLVSGTSIKTVNSNSLLGSGDVTVQATLVSGTSIKTVNGTTLLGSGDLVVSATAPDYRYPLRISSEFYNSATGSISPFVGTAIASGTLTTNVGEVNHPGVCAFRSAISGNTGYNVSARAGGAYYIAGGEVFTFIFQCTVTTNVTSYFGLHDSSTAAEPIDGVYIEIVGTTLNAKTSANSSRSTGASPYTVDNTSWYRINITVNSDATSVSYELFDCSSGNSLWTSTLTTNIPTSAGRQTSIALQSYLTGSAAAADLTQIDYIDFYSTKVLTR